MIDDLRQPAVAGPSVEVNEVGGDADGPFLIQRQCDELGLEFAVISHDIYCTGATGSPVSINYQVQATRVAADLGVVQKRPAGASKVIGASSSTRRRSRSSPKPEAGRTWSVVRQASSEREKWSSMENYL